MELPSAIVTVGTILSEDSGAAFKQKKGVSGCLGMPGGKSLDMPRTPYQASERKHSQQLTMPYHATLKSSSVHHSSHQRTALLTTPPYPLTLSCCPLTPVHLSFMPPHQPSTPCCHPLLPLSTLF